MTDIAETALAFCREVMGWERPVMQGDLLIFETFPGQVQWGKSFAYTDLNAVLDAVERYCKEKFLQWAVFGNHRHKKQEKKYLAFLLPFDDFWEARCVSDDRCDALMRACLETERKLKGDA